MGFLDKMKNAIGLGDEEYYDEDDILTSDFEAWATRIKGHADQLGVQYTHSHASFDADASGDIVYRNFRSAQLLGIRYMVIHPAFRTAEGRIYEDAEEFLDVNTKAFLPLVRKAADYGLTLLSENLLWGASIPLSLQSELVERVNC